MQHADLHLRRIQRRPRRMGLRYSTMRRILILFLLLLCIGASGDRGAQPSHEQVIARFGTSHAAVSGRCAMWGFQMLGAQVCTTQNSSWRAPRDFTITNVILCVGDTTYTGTEACDADVEVGGAGVITFDLGHDSLLDDEGDCADKDSSVSTSLSTTTVNAGDAMFVRYDDPDPTDFCETPTCDCDNISGSHHVTVWGVPR